MRTNPPTSLFLAGLALLCAACTPTVPAASDPGTKQQLAENISFWWHSGFFLRPPVQEPVGEFQSKPMTGIRASRAALEYMQQAQTGKALVLLADEWILDERKDVRLIWVLGEDAGERLREIFRARAVPNPNVKDLPGIDIGSDIVAGCILPSTDFNEAVWICIGSTGRVGYESNSLRAFRLADIAPLSRSKGNRRAYYLLPDADYDYILGLLPRKDMERSHGAVLQRLSRPAFSNTL